MEEFLLGNHLCKVYRYQETPLPDPPQPPTPSSSYCTSAPRPPPSSLHPQPIDRQQRDRPLATMATLVLSSPPSRQIDENNARRTRSESARHPRTRSESARHPTAPSRAPARQRCKRVVQSDVSTRHVHVTKNGSPTRPQARRCVVGLFLIK